MEVDCRINKRSSGLCNMDVGSTVSHAWNMVYEYEVCGGSNVYFT
jgi:hypothetical protein